MSTRTGMAKTRSTSTSTAMLPSRLRLDATIRFKHATKIARFLICSGKSATPIPNALGGDMESIDSIHPGGDASGSGALSRLLKPRAMSRPPTVTLMTVPTVETASCASPKRTSPKIPITVQVAKYPSARAVALGRGRREPRNRIVMRSKGGATEPPMARTRSPGRSSLIGDLLAVALATRKRSCCFRAAGWCRRADYHGCGFLCQRRLLLRDSGSYECGRRPFSLRCYLLSSDPILRRGAVQTAPRRYRHLLPFVCEGLAQLSLLLLGKVGRDDLEVVCFELVDHLVDRRRAA